MDEATIQALRELDNRFYRDHRESFSATRQGAWQGWERIARHLAPGRLLDVACGNLRFERFLEGRFGKGSFEFSCLDSCAALAGPCEGVDFAECDVIGALVEGEGLAGAVGGGFDAAVSFGFMHHVPSHGLRVALARQMLGLVRPGGVVALSFWQFMQDGRLARKARAATAAGCAELGLELGAGDYLLGWNGVEGAYRYCHGFTGGEVDALLSEALPGAVPVDRFEADGRNGAMNGYAVVRRAR